ncbi:hypothetical protein [Microcoleus sp. bin48.metabat.b7b8b9.023]|uniref:hypothetical protein n=1 Tax=Microcoleus sp. bin48.metabat.b7b8b9.023 TaxID=2742710 RepID=UPI0025EA41FF|nr:hypothetical protein [Microcoleus sp. bin48.metabat.b7b8b9.023]
MRRSEIVDFFRACWWRRTLRQTVNCQLSTINEEGGHGGTAPTNYQLPTVNYQLSTVFMPASPPVPGD